MSDSLDTSQIKNWRSIVTLIVFVLTNIVVLFPFHIPIYLPRSLCNVIRDTLSAWRIIPARRKTPNRQSREASVDGSDRDGKPPSFVRLNFPMNFVTAPLIADLFLLAILAIGRQEVHDGTVGAHNINPIDIMVFFLTLAYIAISIDASGLIRYLAFKVVQKGGKVGHKLFLYLYSFFFCLGSFIGNDPIILSGTAFLAYMTRVSDNIVHPRAWIHTQFAVANIASAILVSSNPTNLVLAGAFQIKFTEYTANMIVPVVITAIVLFPFLLYIVFADTDLIPLSITIHELPDEEKAKDPVNPNIPHAHGDDSEENTLSDEKQRELRLLKEIMNPFLDKFGAGFGAVIMAATLITLLAINAASQSSGEHPVFWVTLPAAFIMFCWDLSFGWYHRHDTREIARKGRLEYERAQAQRAIWMENAKRAGPENSQDGQAQTQATSGDISNMPDVNEDTMLSANQTSQRPDLHCNPSRDFELSVLSDDQNRISANAPGKRDLQDDQTFTKEIGVSTERHTSTLSDASDSPQDLPSATTSGGMDVEKASDLEFAELKKGRGRSTLVSLFRDGYVWSQETFPTVTAVLAHLPFKLVPFAFTMFVLVEALVIKGWVPVFAYGWDHWVYKTGTVGAIGGMGFVSVILCNFAGTNIGSAILLSRIIQAWQDIHYNNGVPISDRTFWATVYSMAIGVNYGAFSMAFSASLAGLLWRDILARKHITVSRFDFARVNLPIIAITMAVGCTILVGEVYIMRHNTPYSMN